MRDLDAEWSFDPAVPDRFSHAACPSGHRAAIGLRTEPLELLLQRDRDGSVLPHLPLVWKSESTTHNPAYPAWMRNVPFAIDEPPYDLPGSVLTVSPVHRPISI